mmetsp:Transcript_77178/g.160646  ORF Transcript_77178/g.160646 Transcript_77178/m.160646 type:complete len:222 (-) Transcript_77178:589-1254(-)
MGLPEVRQVPRNVPMHGRRLLVRGADVALREPHVELLGLSRQGAPRLRSLHPRHDCALVGLHEVDRPSSDEDASKSLEEVHDDLVRPEKSYGDGVHRISELLGCALIKFRDSDPRQRGPQARVLQAQRGQAVRDLDEVGRPKRIHTLQRVLGGEFHDILVLPLHSLHGPEKGHQCVRLEVWQLLLHCRHDVAIEGPIQEGGFAVAPKHVAKLLRQKFVFQL